MVDMPKLVEEFTPQDDKIVGADFQIHAARFHPDGRRIIAGGFDARVRIWNVEGEEPQELPALTGHNGWVQAVAISPDGNRLYSGDSWGRLSCWDIAADAGKLVWSIEDAHDGWLRDIQVSPDGSRLATCGRDRRICLRSKDNGQPVIEPTVHSQDVFSLRFHPTGETLVVGDDRGLVLVISAESGEELRRIDATVLYLEHRLQDVGGVRTLSFDRDGTKLAVGGTIPKNGGTVQGTPTVLLFDFESGEKTHTLGYGAATHCFVHDVQFHPAGFIMVVTSGTPGQGQIVFQKPDDEKPFYQNIKVPNCHSLSFHEPTGKLAIASTNKGSNGNGRRLDANGEYAHNNSPIHLFKFPAATA